VAEALDAIARHKKATLRSPPVDYHAGTTVSRTVTQRVLLTFVRYLTSIHKSEIVKNNYRIAKLAGLLIKTLSKPVSKRIKHEFSRYEITQRMLIGIGQTSHSITSRLTIWSAGYRVRSITPLENSKALSAGAEFVGESFIVMVSGGWIVWEYNRGKDKDRAKEKAVQASAKKDRDALQAKLNSLDVRLKALETVVKTNSRSILNMGEKYVPPPSKDIVPIDPELSGNDETEASEKSDAQTEGKDQVSKNSWWPW
jgi:hypothetical protein